jgi:perosamine synthetase
MSNNRYKSLVDYIRDIFKSNDFIPMHEPRFIGNEKKYVIETIDSTFVSSVGAYVEEFEKNIAEFVGVKYAVATSSGTSALHIALKLGGVSQGGEVITQALTFVATCNAINYCGAEPIFLDVDKDTMGLSPKSLEHFLEEQCEMRDDGICWNKRSNKPVQACLPMHTFGMPARILEIEKICNQYNINLIEDAAESLGSYIEAKGSHTGTIGKLSAFSFNGNKIITTGGGGMIVTNDESIAKQAKHVTTTAKIPHRWEFNHDEIGYNYRLPNLNAALGVAQLELLPNFLEKKRILANQYQEWGSQHGFNFVGEQQGVRANYWLNILLAENIKDRDAILSYTNDNAIMTRPIWTLMNKLSMFSASYSDGLNNSYWLADRLINVPSSVILDT